MLEEKTVFLLSDLCRDLKDVVQAAQGSMKRDDVEKRVRDGRSPGWGSGSGEVWGSQSSLGSGIVIEGNFGGEEGFKLEEWVSEKEREGIEGFWAGDGVFGG